MSGFLLLLVAASSGLIPTPAFANCEPLTYPLSQKMYDVTTMGQVSQLQKFLARDRTLYPEALITGYFGPATRRAVKRFQVKTGIVSAGASLSNPTVGMVGPLTRAVLNTQMCELMPQTVAQPVQNQSNQNVTPASVQQPVNTNNTSSGTSQSVQSSLNQTQQTTPAQAQITIPALVPPQVQQTPARAVVTQPVAQPQLPPVSVVFPPTPTFLNQVVTGSHRFQQNVAFGGWGPHLGKLMRAPDGSLWMADDTGNNVLANDGISYYHQINGQWVFAGSNNFFGVIQQNTGSVLRGDTIYSYGIDTKNHRVEECYFSTVKTYKACNSLPFELSPNANYIGAALTPSGYTMVWWTNVVNNGAGTFEYIYNFGGGWNGPVSSGIGGFSDASYANIAFYNDSSFVIHAELVTGDAPNWKFVGSFADGSLGNAIAEWKTLSPVGGTDSIISTDDVWVDAKGGAHILARSQNGTMVYYYRPRGGSFSGVLAAFPGVYRARFVDSSNGQVYLVYGKAGDGLRVITIDKSTSRGALPLQESASQKVSTPSGYTTIDAIYPESRIYQTVQVQGMHILINGRDNQGELVHIELR